MTDRIRLPDWKERVWAVYYDYRDNRKFEWGKSDCIQMTAELQKACYGKIVAEDFYHTYSSLEEGYKVLFSKYKSVSDAMDHYCLKRIPLEQADFGDVGLTLDPSKNEPLLQLFLNPTKKVTFNSQGLIDLGARTVEHVWVI